MKLVHPHACPFVSRLVLCSLLLSFQASCFRSGFAPSDERDVGAEDAPGSDGDVDVDADPDSDDETIRDAGADADDGSASGDADADLDADFEADVDDASSDADPDEEVGGDGDADRDADIEADAEADADEDAGEGPIVVTGDTCIDATVVAGGGLAGDECLEILIDTRTATNDYDMGSTACGTQPDVVISFNSVEPGASRSFSCAGVGAMDLFFDDFFDPTCPPPLGTYTFNLTCGGAPAITFLRGGDYPTVVCRDGALPPATLWYCRSF